MPEPSLSTADPTRIGLHGASYKVQPTAPEHAEGLGPISVSVEKPGFRWNDYMTPDEADALAGWLRAAARTERDRLDAIGDGLDVLAEAAHTPYPKAA